MPKKFPDKIVKTSKPNLEEQFRLQMEKELQEFKDNHELERKIFNFFIFGLFMELLENTGPTQRSLFYSQCN